MYWYIKDNCFVCMQVPYAEALVSTEINNQAIKYVALNEAQIAFKTLNPEATTEQVWNQQIN